MSWPTVKLFACQLRGEIDAQTKAAKGLCLLYLDESVVFLGFGGTSEASTAWLEGKSEITPQMQAEESECSLCSQQQDR